MDEMIKEDGEIEEGECSDQDDMGIGNSYACKDTQDIEVPHAVETNMYRQGRIPQIIINSDQSDEDDSDEDDDYPSYEKKSRTFSNFNNQNETPTEFVNPLRSSGMADLSSERSFPKKHRNNVWGAVMTEQMLAQDIKQCGVNAAFTGANRDVESYDFTIAKEDDREEIEIKTDVNEKDDIFTEVVDLEREVKKHQNRKRKRNVKDRVGAGGKRSAKDRLGMKVCDENDRLGQVIVTETDDVHRVTKAITGALGEQNITLFTRIVEVVGNEKALQLYNMTVDVEKSGGMMINSGNRRRTPGGVFIQLLRSDSSITPDLVSAVFEQEDQKWMDRRKEIRKIKKAARKKWNRQNKPQGNIDLDRPETPTPPDDLEDLDNVNDLEVDVSDLPDRPDTPEPKDSSEDNESADEEEEEDDIAVAIAKAKAAILKKQAEMAEKKVLPEQSGEGVLEDCEEMS